MKRWLVLLLFLAGCAESVWAPDDAVQRAFYHQPGPTKLTLVTVISNTSNGGAHSGLVISGSQRVVFDPSGTWWHQQAPERNDVHFGMTETMLRHYLDYHARTTFRVVTQEIEVSPEVAETALRLAMDNGAVGNGFCTNATSNLIRRIPGFESIRATFFPKNLMRQFGQLPNIKTQTIYDDSPADNKDLLGYQVVDG